MSNSPETGYYRNSCPPFKSSHYHELMESFRVHGQRKETRYQRTGRVIYDEFDQKPSKPVIGKIDRVLA